MSIWLRFFWVIIAGFFKKPLAMSGVSILRQRVWLDELDINVHMNNAKYLAVMDLGRTDWIVRTGAWRWMRYDKMSPVVGGAMIRYRRSLKLFQPYFLKTRLLGWDDRWLYVEQAMECRDGALACLAVQRTGFTLRGKLVAPSDLARRLGQDASAMPAPDWTRGWGEAEAAFVKGSEV
jgi:acyl-CoA thioesterase FadM